MSEARQILETIIDDFSAEKFSRFFREKSRQFVAREESHKRYNDNEFKNGLKIGEINFSDNDKMIICAFEVKKELSERSGKKAQYEKAKVILKSAENQKYSAGIFIFYDENGNFRFSLIYDIPHGNRRDWNNFRRYTYFVSLRQTNKTFLQRISGGDFLSLEKVKDAFSVEKVTKDFYKDIANWYFWAIQKSEFPKDAEVEENGRNITIIRLITRLIFIWFMRERGLVPNGLFQKQKINDYLKDLSSEKSTYYKAILQNLFFATLSTEQKERKYASEKRYFKGWNEDYGNQYVFRYQELFKNPDKLKSYFGDIPFLNGGLFECLDDKRNGIIVDGFSRIKKNQPVVPNFLFFSNEQKVDLNAEYGTKKKKYKVRGLIDTLSSYNFTIDENDPNDAEVALDPELLGKVFENLLASVNPETSSTARKATGSYYTPREIVDYMVAESLKAYFKTHLVNVKDINKKLESLFSITSEENPFDVQESEKLVGLIESVKIVDPAVGSGAFPMGMLNKLVFILNKVDPGNELWKQAQLKAADAIPDPGVRRDAKVRIEEFFKGKNADYGRKLYLIQRCIYGVDIQQIAVEIAKLRFFISLLVDEKIDQNKDNWGIEPLPNLDFKIMQGNSLISEFLGIDFDNGHNKKNEQVQVGLLFKQEYDNLIKEFEHKKIDFQNESDKNKKKNLKEEVEDLMIKVFEQKLQEKCAELKPIEEKAQSIPNLKTREEYIKIEKAKVAKKYGLDLDNIEKQLREFTSKKKTRPFFPWKLYFAEVFEKGGFDIVIANPPYVTTKYGKISDSLKKIYLNTFESAYDKLDLYVLFIEKAIKISKQHGYTTFITPWNFLANFYSFKIRKFLLDNVRIKLFNKLPPKVFGSIIVDNIISIFERDKENQGNKILFDDLFNKDNRRYMNQDDYLQNDNYVFMIQNDSIAIKILNKMRTDFKELEKIALNYIGIMTGGQKKMIADKPVFKNSKPVLSGKDIDKWVYSDKGNYVNFDKSKIHSNDKEEVYLAKKKILLRKTGRELTACIDENQYFTIQSLYNIVVKNKNYTEQYLLALLNSKLFTYIYNKFFITNPEVFPYIKRRHLDKFPIKKISSIEQKSFVEIVNKILAITKNVDYLQNEAQQKKVKEYENQIDRLVYKLYNLNEKEIETVENFNK